ncbi:MULTISPECIES: hypothetical protein [unclassified Haloarcula]|uniref:hypothetical protein n=1 Tax=unclassified Haloarcula TaxID=2624677 RepID=UPI0005955632|nr:MULTISPECIES: hypothetical protein [unclassified Haloarcula]AJF26819.1 hypothetical protein SG26_14320 [Haloarcula sp. CBA1115]
MGVREFLKTVSRHPLAKATGVSALVGIIIKLPLVVALVGTLWAQLGTLFTAFSVTAFSIAPRVPFIPTGIAQNTALVIGGLFVVKLVVVKVLHSFYKEIQKSN